MGRRTYEAFAAVWPTMKDDAGFADKMNSMPKHVASRTLKETTWNATVIQGDLAEAVDRLKRAPGKDILQYGYGPVTGTLIEHGLLDELRLWLHPILVGRGAGGRPADRAAGDGHAETGRPEALRLRPAHPDLPAGGQLGRCGSMPTGVGK